MRSQRPIFFPALAVPRRRGRGSAALELFFVLLIFVLVVALVLELGGRVAQRRRCHLFIADLRDFSAAYQRWDAAEAPRAEEMFAGTRWSQGAPFGGDYQLLENRDAGAAVAVTAFAPRFPLKLSRADLLFIDAELDDGDLATGRFRTGFNGWPVYRLGAK